HRVGAGSEAAHPPRFVDHFAHRDAAADGAGGIAEAVHRLRIEEIDDVLRLPRRARVSGRPLGAFTARGLVVERLDIREFLSRYEHDGFDWRVVSPLHHRTADIDDD